MTRERTRLSVEHQSEYTLLKVTNRDDNATVATLILSPEDCEWLRKQLLCHKTLPEFKHSKA